MPVLAADAGPPCATRSTLEARTLETDQTGVRKFSRTTSRSHQSLLSDCTRPTREKRHGDAGHGLPARRSHRFKGCNLAQIRGAHEAAHAHD